ncbi:MAG TPA: bifunctional diaminohydroxyphosphoribosylaminopyrimidine deaminase/5-amino-6-(5-phosphoribosylamino)uracil reductase RibD [Methylibium sp.]
MPHTFSPRDEELMRLALAEAQQALPLSPPNPAVGCVIADAEGQILGQGHTQLAGGPHAEVMALRAARTRRPDLAGCTAYVTLEPCSHHGRTPPCVNALIEHSIARVVAAVQDPNPLVAGRGLAMLREAGVQVELGLLGEQARELNIGFFSRMVRRRPWLRMKVAASLDGVTALDNGASQWITSEAARTDGHRWRARAGAVLTGVGTVREDDPRLDVRLVPTQRQPIRVIVDSRLETPRQAHILAPPGEVLIYCASATRQDAAEFQALGAQLIALPNQAGKVELAAMLKDLAQRGINELHVEAGHRLNGSLLREGLVDEFLIYLAPKLLGQGRSMASFGPLHRLQDAVELEFLDVEHVGPDLRIVARPPGRATF